MGIRGQKTLCHLITLIRNCNIISPRCIRPSVDARVRVDHLQISESIQIWPLSNQSKILAVTTGLRWRSSILKCWMANLKRAYSPKLIRSWINCPEWHRRSICLTWWTNTNRLLKNTKEEFRSIRTSSNIRILIMSSARCRISICLSGMRARVCKSGSYKCR